MKTTKFVAVMAMAATIMTSCGKQESSNLYSDLSLNDLRGNVESVKMLTLFLSDEGKPIGEPMQSGMIEYFNDKGEICTPNVKIERDSQNRISTYKYEEKMEVCDEEENPGREFDIKYVEKKFTYDENNSITEWTLVERVPAYNSTDTFTSKCYYDDNKHLVKVDMHCHLVSEYSETYDIKKVIEYILLETDEQGNWTKRKVCTKEDMGTWTHVQNVIEEREITYRK